MSRHQNESQNNNRDHLKCDKVTVSENNVKLSVTHGTITFTLNLDDDDDSTVQFTIFCLPLRDLKT